MGRSMNYYKILNLSKREKFEPEFTTISAFTREGASIVSLMLGDWCGDTIRVVGDWEDEDSEAFTLYAQAMTWRNRWAVP